MAGLAGRGRVRSCQWEFGGAMIECRRLPRSCRVTRRAILTEVPCDVVWICCARKVGAVALVTA